MMKAMVVREFGGPEVFEAAELDKPEVKAGHVLVQIAASSVNMVDTMIGRWVKTCRCRRRLPPYWAWILPVRLKPLARA